MAGPVEQIGAYAFAVAAGGALGWFLNMAKTHSEMEKLRAEKKKLEEELLSLKGNNILKIQTSRRESDEANRAMTDALNELVTCFADEADGTTLDKAREDVADKLTGSVIPRFLDYVEIHTKLRYTDPAEVGKFIDRDVLDELARWHRWLRTLNHPNFLKRLPDRQPLTITKRTLYPFRELAKDTTELARPQYLAKLDAAIESILSAGRAELPAPK